MAVDADGKAGKFLTDELCRLPNGGRECAAVGIAKAKRIGPRICRRLQNGKGIGGVFPVAIEKMLRIKNDPAARTF